MRTLTHQQFLARLISLNGTAIVGLEALTDARARVNPHGKILKQVRAVGFVGANYEKAVQREGDRVGMPNDFHAKPLPWGQWHPEAFGKVIVHQGSMYLRTQSTPGQRRNQPARLLAYRDASGMFLPSTVREFIPGATYSVRQGDAGLGEWGAHEQVWVRTYKFDSIRKVRINGQTFRLVAA